MKNKESARNQQIVNDFLGSLQNVSPKKKKKIALTDRQRPS
jgi:hypothetical protein